MIGRLVILGREIDISEEVAVPLSYSIADIKSPEKRKRNSSKTISLPGTRNNMDFFSSTYQLSLTALENGGIVGFDFDPTLRVEAQYYKRGVKIFDGIIQLLSVEIKDKAYYFNCSMFSNFVNLFESLGDITVPELGWAEYNHTLSITNIENSWDTSVVVNGTPTVNFTAGVPDAFGYLYPLADYGYSNNLVDYLTNNIFTHVYVKEVVEKCFERIGQTIDSDFFDTERFKRLVYGFGGGEKITIAPAEVLLRRVNYNGVGTYTTEIHHVSAQYIAQDFINGAHWQYTYVFNQRLKWGDNFWMAVTLVDDDLTQMDEPGEAITIARSGNYNIRFNSDFDITQTTVGSILAGSNFQMSLKTSVFRNGGLVGVFDIANTGASTTVSIDTTLNFNFVAGDVIHTEIQPYVNGQGILRSLSPPSSAPYVEYELTNNGTWNQDVQALDAPVVDGDTIHVANYLPQQKAAEFLKDIITMFNLYITEPDVDNVVTIEPLEDYYFDTNVFDDWTHNLDHSKDIEIRPCSNIEGKVYAYKWAEDGDYYNVFHKELTGIGYGDYNYQVPSTFQKGEKVFQLRFAQSVPVEVPGTNIIIPTIIKVDDSGTVTPFKGKPRIYIYSGLRNSNSWVLRNSQNLTTTASYTSYPCINHLDDIDAPTFDLNWGLPNPVYWTATSYTLLNMFSQYSEKSIKEITGKDSKILSAYFLLNEMDLYPESFRRLKMINGVLFRLNEIKDFAGNGDQTVPVELVRIIEAKQRRDLTGYVSPGPIILGELLNGGSDSSDSDVGVYSGGNDSIDTNSIVRYG